MVKVKVSGVPISSGEAGIAKLTKFSFFTKTYNMTSFMTFQKNFCGSCIRAMVTQKFKQRMGSVDMRSICLQRLENAVFSFTGFLAANETFRLFSCWDR